jgi:ubiquitin carboxyl-terminal hydrolase 48
MFFYHQVLNFQLMRFQFDVNTGRKKKVKSVIKFPAKLDMTPFVSPELKANALEVEYQLSSVLIHKGASAYGGHYIALVRDEEYALQRFGSM